jgi:hypothetical protein
MTDKERAIKELKTIPNIGPRIADKFFNIGIKKVSDLKDRDPEEIYVKCCGAEGYQIDRCFLYVIRQAVYFASTKNPDPALLQWNIWSDKNQQR